MSVPFFFRVFHRAWGIRSIESSSFRVLSVRSLLSGVWGSLLNRNVVGISMKSLPKLSKHSAIKQTCITAAVLGSAALHPTCKDCCFTYTPSPNLDSRRLLLRRPACHAYRSHSRGIDVFFVLLAMTGKPSENQENSEPQKNADQNVQEMLEKSAQPNSRKSSKNAKGFGT